MSRNASNSDDQSRYSDEDEDENFYRAYAGAPQESLSGSSSAQSSEKGFRPHGHGQWNRRRRPQKEEKRASDRLPRWDQGGRQRRRGSIDSAFSSSDYEHEERLRLHKVKGAEHDRNEEEFEMTVTHSKILILVSKYGHCAVTPEEPESWIRQLPLMVMVYEGIRAGVIECDYSPSSTIISYEGSSRRLFLNISQEAKSCIDELREQKLIGGLKISSEDLQPITAYQVSLEGVKFLKTLPDSLFQEISSFVYAPNAPHYDSELLTASFDGERFLLTTRSGYQRESTVTDTEDVSYVTSPYLPETLRTPWGKALSSNAHRAHEAAIGVSNIKDELSEAIRLCNANVLVGEWVPFGANSIVALCERLGALDRCQGGFFTALVDKTPLNTNFKVPTGLTDVKVIDFDLIHFCNIEAEINYPEEKGIVQVESFGMHMNMDGSVFCGIKVESIMDRGQDHVSIDLLARVLVDVQLDSSKIMEDLLSGYQRGLLDMIFLGDNLNRSKFNLIVAETIHPKLSAREYMDRGFFENELKQVLGDIFVAEDIGNDDIVLIGKLGLLIAGPSASSFGPYILYYTSLLCREVFVRNYFLRTFMLNDALNKIRHLTLQVHNDPENVNRIRMALSEASRDLILLEETLSYLAESLQDLMVPELPQDAKGQRLYEILNCKGMNYSVKMRVDDMAKLISGAANQLRNLQQNTDVISTKQLEDVFKNVDSNTKFLVDASAANERSSASLSVMQVVLAGGFCFNIVDRIAGGTLNINQPSWVYSYIYEPLIVPPGIWFTFNMVWLFACSYALIRLMRYLAFAASGTLTLRVTVNKKLKSIQGLHTFFSDKYIDIVDSDTEAETCIKEVEWKELDDEEHEYKWLGSAPKVGFVYDYRHKFVLNITFTLDKKKSVATEEDLVKILLQDLVLADAMDLRIAFGPETEEGEVGRALEISREQHAAETKKKKKGWFGWMRKREEIEQD